jgi:hypothetical protein
MLDPCPECQSDQVKPRTGSLGEELGVWCTQCGFKTDSEEKWANQWRGSKNPVIVDLDFSGPPRDHLDSILQSLRYHPADYSSYSDREIEDCVIDHMIGHGLTHVIAVVHTKSRVSSAVFTKGYNYTISSGRLVLA